MGRHSASGESGEDPSTDDVARAQLLTGADSGRHTPPAAVDPPTRPIQVFRAEVGDEPSDPARGGLNTPPPPTEAPLATAAPLIGKPATGAPLIEKPATEAPLIEAPLIGAPLPPLLYAEIPDGRPDAWASTDGSAVLTLPELSDGLAPQVSATRTSRAGRNLPAAIGVSLGLGAVIIASLLTYRPSFVVIICAAMAYGIYEMTRAIGAAEARPPLVPLAVGGLAMDIAAWYRGANGLVVGLLLTVLGVTIWRLAEGAVGYARDVTSAAFIALYVPLLGGFAVLLTHYSDGAGRVIAFIATVVCSDVGGYAAGVLFGKHPMAPTVSPKKSWEGFVGSALACSIGGALFMSLLFHHRWWIGVLYGLAIAVTATLGDLGESMVKRDLGVKDMGRLLPGHGGLMDRLDSLLPCAAVAYLIMAAAL